MTNDNFARTPESLVCAERRGNFIAHPRIDGTCDQHNTRQEDALERVAGFSSDRSRVPPSVLAILKVVNVGDEGQPESA
ncbi:MAG: hypothetical protein MPJ50_09825 [Pirellulales bacterium]|nr:hypothetical protein [Pirellulales bacterium]